MENPTARDCEICRGAGEMGIMLRHRHAAPAGGLASGLVLCLGAEGPA
jgi:hypothetical protein